MSLNAYFYTFSSHNYGGESEIGFRLSIVYEAGGCSFSEQLKYFEDEDIHACIIESDGTHVFWYDRSNKKVVAKKITDGAEPAVSTAITTYGRAWGRGRLG